MGQVSITLNDRTYRLVCGEGEEDRLVELASYVKAKVEKLGAELGHVGDERLMLMAALTIADELFDARAAVQGHDEAASDRAHDAVVAAPVGAAPTAVEPGGDLVGKLKTVAALMAAKQGGAAQPAAPVNAPTPITAAKHRRRDVG